jgi:hypothetical protein
MAAMIQFTKLQDRFAKNRNRLGSVCRHCRPRDYHAHRTAKVLATTCGGKPSGVRRS